jgi:cardiolipin synthase (CMP-forming)
MKIKVFKDMQEQLKILHEDFKQTFVLFEDNKLKHIPNILTITRLLSVPVIVVLFLLNNPIMLFIVSFLASFTDMLDGNISRKMGANNAFGKKLDPLADKFLAGTLLIINAITFQVFTVSIILELFIAKINMTALKENKNAKTNQDGRVKTAFLYGTLLIGLLDKVIPMLKPITVLGFAATSILQAKAINSYISDYDLKEEVKVEHHNTIPDVKSSNKSEKQMLKDLKNNLLYKEDEQKDKEKTLI